MKINLKALATPTHVLLVLILLVGFGLRVYNIQNTLGFYYDQGRDALAIWDLWHKADFWRIFGKQHVFDSVFPDSSCWYLRTFNLSFNGIYYEN